MHNVKPGQKSSCFTIQTLVGKKKNKKLQTEELQKRKQLRKRNTIALSTYWLWIQAAT